MTTQSSTFSSSAEASLAYEAAPATLAEARSAELDYPNALVRWAVYLSIFSIPFSHVYLPGTSERVGITRIVQLLMLCGVLSQPRVCLRLVPKALFWFLGYIGIRIIWGFWLTPDQFSSWWEESRTLIEFLPWLWIMFNVLQFPETRRGALWALGLGCSACAMFHLAGIGVMDVVDGLEVRSAAFGMNPNEEGAGYSTAIISLLGLWMIQPRTRFQRLAPFPLIAIIAAAIAKTGSRTALLVVVVGSLVLLLFGEAFGSKTKRLAGLAALGAMLAIILWQIPTVMDRFGEINTQNIGSHNPRARMAPVLWEMYLRSPIYGLGPDSYQWELTRRAMPYLINQGKLIRSHNLALLLLVETGLVGFVVFSVGLGKALVAAWRARLKPCGPLPLALLLPLALGALTVCNPSAQPVFWATIAYALAAGS